MLTGRQDKMPSIAKSQAAFAAALLNPELPAPYDIARPGLDRNVSAQTKRFDVYRNNVFATAVDALAESFPAVERLVGEDFFRAVARAYIEFSPPKSPILAQIGATFGTFLDDFPPAAGVPYVGDIARLEYARIEAFHAADCTSIQISTLVDIDPEFVGQTTLTPHSSLSLIRSKFPVGSLWAASIDALNPSDVDMSEGQDVLVLRPELDVESIVLPPGGGAFLAALLDGQPIEVAAEVGAAESTIFDLSSHLAGAFTAGAFIAASANTGDAHRTEEQKPCSTP